MKDILSAYATEVRRFAYWIMHDRATEIEKALKVKPWAKMYLEIEAEARAFKPTVKPWKHVAACGCYYTLHYFKNYGRGKAANEDGFRKRRWTFCSVHSEVREISRRMLKREKIYRWRATHKRKR